MCWPTVSQTFQRDTGPVSAKEVWSPSWPGSDPKVNGGKLSGSNDSVHEIHEMSMKKESMENESG